MYVLSEEDDLNAKIASLHRKVDAIQKPNVVKVADSVEHACGICESLEHYTKDCPKIPAFQEVLHDQANAMNTYKRPFNSPYSETYNPNWRNHPNFSWRNGPTMNDVNVPQGSSSSNPYAPPHKNNLEDTLQTFMQGQTQINQNVMKTLDELKTSIVRIESRLNVREKGTFPSQTQPNQKGQFEVKNSNVEQDNVVTTLRSGKVIETPMKVNEPEKSPEFKSSDGHSNTQNEHSEIDRKMYAPFPHRLLSTKQLADNKDILDVFQQVKINIPLLSVIKQVPAYAKFLKDLCTVKRKHNVQKKAFLTEQVSSILQHNTPPKYKDPGCPTISCIIGDFMIKQALLDLGPSGNLLPFSVYEQLGLGELKPTSVTLQLADRSVKVLRGVVENVLIQIDKFYYPVDFIILDTQPVANASKEIHVILGRLFLATANALINCRTGIMNLSFGNMTVELNIFDACKDTCGRDDIHEVNMIETCMQKKSSHMEAKVPLESCFPNLWDFDEDGYIEEVNSSLNSSLLLDMDKWHSRFESLQISETKPLSPSVEFPKTDLNPFTSELNFDVLSQIENVPVFVPSELNEEQETMHSHVLRKHISVAGWSIADIERIDPSICTRRKSQLNELHEIINGDDTNCKCKMKLCLNKHDIKEIVEPVLCHDSHLHQFSGKLKSRWKEQFNVQNKFRDCTVGIQNPNDNIFKVNVQRLEPFLELVNPEVDTTTLEDPSYV